MADYSGLQYQVQSLRVHGGQMEAVDDWLLEPPQNRAVVNGRFDTTGVIGKRYGQEFIDGSSIPTADGYPRALYEAKGELATIGESGTYMLDEDLPTPAWRSLGLLTPRLSRCITDPLVRQNGTIMAPDVAFVGNVGCVVWNERMDAVGDSLTAWYQFFDATTLAVLSGPTQILDTSPWTSRVLIAGNENSGCFWIVGSYVSGGTINRIATYNVSAGTYEFSGFISRASFPAEDIIPYANEAMVLGRSSGNTQFELWSATPGLVWSQTTGQTFLGLSVCHNPVSGQFVAVAGDGRIALCDDDGLSAPTVVSVFTVPSDFPSGTTLFTTIATYGTSGDMMVAMSPWINPPIGLETYTPRFDDGGGITEWGTFIGTCDSAGNLIAEKLRPVASLLGRAVTDSNGVVSIPLAHLQSAAEKYASLCNLVPEGPDDGDGNNPPTLVEVARFGVEQVSRLVRTGALGHAVISGGKVKFAYSVAYAAEGTGTFGTLDTIQYQIDMASSEPFTPRSARANSDTFVGGGVVSTLDGTRHFEASVCRPIIGMYPTQTGEDQSMGTFGIASSAVLTLKVCYRFIDHNGNITRSAPSQGSQAFSISRAVPGYPKPITVSAPWPTAIDPYDRYTRWDLEIHQLTTDGTYGFVGVVTPRDSVSATTPPIHPEQTVFFVADVSSPSITTDTRHLILLTTAVPSPGDYPQSWFETELEPTIARPAVDITSSQDRLWMISGEAGRTQVAFTKPIEASLAPEWPIENTVLLPHEGGEAVGIGSIDDKVIVLKKNRAYALFGDPGDATGANSTLQQARLISSDVGCIDPRTIVEGPWGLVFLSERGFYKLGRDLAMEFIGEPVKDTTIGKTFCAGVVVPSQSQVRWPLDGGPNTQDTLVWDYRQNAWTRWSGEYAAHATTVGGVYCRLVYDSAIVYRETPQAWTSLPTLYGTSIQTGWIDLTGTQGYQRIKEALVLIRYYSGARVSLAASYDYDDARSESWAWSSTELDALAAGNGRVQLRVKPSYRKCESVRFTIIEQPQFGETSDPGRGIDFVGIDLVVGSKRSAFKSGLAAGAKK